MKSNKKGRQFPPERKPQPHELSVHCDGGGRCENDGDPRCFAQLCLIPSQRFWLVPPTELKTKSCIAN